MTRARQHDPSGLAASVGNRGVRLGHELRDDLHQIDSALGEGLTEVATPRARDQESWLSSVVRRVLTPVLQIPAPERLSARSGHHA
jgi:hypothetical protein